jgi:hypothetical protein
MILITKAQTEQLLANGHAQRATIERQDHAFDLTPDSDGPDVMRL